MHSYVVAPLRLKHPILQAVPVFFDAYSSGAIGVTRPATPGPGSVQFTAINGSFSLGNGKLNTTGQSPDNGDTSHTKLGFWSLDAYDRLPGLALFGRITTDDPYGMVGTSLGFKENQSLQTGFTDGSRHSINYNIGFAVLVDNLGGAQLMAPSVRGAEYKGCIILRETGAFYLIKGPSDVWRHLFIAEVGIHSPMYIVLSYGTGPGVIDNVLATYLPEYTGWANNNAGIYSQVTGPLADGYLFNHPSSFVVKWQQGSLPASGVVDVSFRRQDANNRYSVTIDSAGVLSLYRVQAGVSIPMNIAANFNNFRIAAGNWVSLVGSNERLDLYLHERYIGAFDNSPFLMEETHGKIESLQGTQITNLKLWPWKVQDDLASILDDLS